MSQEKLSKKTVVVAMSGGVDSSAAAYLLKQEGYDVIGVSMKTHETTEDEMAKGKTCCTSLDIMDARRVCQQLDIPFYAINFVDEFEEKVIQRFGSEYAQGRTPNPCVYCNSFLKFDSLLQKARELGAYYLATGHYARKEKDADGRYHLIRSIDDEKDQTYFLFGLKQEQLEHILFPVGGYRKAEVRKLAEEAGLRTAHKPESQEICFVPNNDYSSFLSKNYPEFTKPSGDFVNPEGEVLGPHEGIHGYTVGQRRGLRVAAGERLYVLEILPKENRVILGRKEELLKTGLKASGVHWIQSTVGKEKGFVGKEVLVQIRHRHAGVMAIIEMAQGNELVVRFKTPEGAVTPGQVAVVYDGNEVLGGGFIDQAL